MKNWFKNWKQQYKCFYCGKCEQEKEKKCKVKEKKVPDLELDVETIGITLAKEINEDLVRFIFELDDKRVLYRRRLFILAGILVLYVLTNIYVDYFMY